MFIDTINRLLVVMVMLATTSVSSLAKDYSLEESRDIVKKYGIDEVVDATLDAANEMLPTKVDEYTTVGKQHYLRSEKVIVCPYILDIKKMDEGTTAQLKQLLLTQKINRRCKVNLVYMESGVTYSHLYVYSDKTPIFSYDVSIENCD